MAVSESRCCRRSCSCSSVSCGRLGALGPLGGRLSPGRLSRPPRMSMRCLASRERAAAVATCATAAAQTCVHQRRRQQQRSHTADGTSCTTTAAVNGARRGPQEMHARGTPLRFRVASLAGIQNVKNRRTRRLATGRPRLARARVPISAVLFPLSRRALLVFLSAPVVAEPATLLPSADNYGGDDDDEMCSLGRPRRVCRLT